MVSSGFQVAHHRPDTNNRREIACQARVPGSRLLDADPCLGDAELPSRYHGTVDGEYGSLGSAYLPE
jgi:hypothetical protein